MYQHQFASNMYELPEKGILEPQSNLQIIAAPFSI